MNFLSCLKNKQSVNSIVAAALTENVTWNYCLFQSVIHANYDAVKEFIKRGADPNSNYVISYALMNWHRSMTLLLLKAGASMDTVDEKGRNMWHYFSIGAKIYDDLERNKFLSLISNAIHATESTNS